MSESSPLSFFASKTLTMHLLRGALAAMLLTAAVMASDTQPILSVAAGIAAIVMLRGCPMCWTVGLIETIRHRFNA